MQDTTVFGRGTQEVAGKAVATTVQNGGEMTVKDGGAAEKTTVSGGTMTVDEEGIAQNTTVLSGTQYVYGRDINGRVSGGEQIIEGGGSAENAVVSETVFSRSDLRNVGEYQSRCRRCADCRLGRNCCQYDAKRRDNEC